MGRSETPRRYQLDAGYWAARGRFRSNPANACAPVRGPLPPTRGVTYKNRAFTRGAGPCGGSRAAGPPVTFLSGRCVGDEIVQAGPSKWLTRESGGYARFCGIPKRHCPAIPSRIAHVPSIDLQVQGGLFG